MNCFDSTAEERLGDMARRGKIGPAEGEPGVTRVESFTSNGVQVGSSPCFSWFVVHVVVGGGDDSSDDDGDDVGGDRGWLFR